MTRHWLTRRLVHTCTVWRDSGTAQDTTGEVARSWSALTTAQPCRFTQSTEGFANEASGFVVLERDFALMNGTANVTTEDRLSTIEDADGNSVAAGTYEVTRVLIRRGVGGNLSHTRVDLERVEAS